MSPDFDHDRSAGLDRELQRLADAAGRRAHAPAPGHIRAMGQRRHRRRVAAVAVTTAVATVMAGGIALGAMTSGPKATDIAPQPTQTPTRTPTAPDQAPTSGPLDSGDLLTIGDVRYALAGGDWQEVLRGTPRRSLLDCAEAATSGGEQEALARQFQRRTDDGSTVLATQLVERHADAAAAREAYDEIVQWFASCDPKDLRELARTSDQGVSFAVVPAEGKAVEVGIARAGKLVVLVARSHEDSEWDDGVTSVRALTSIATARLTDAPEPRVDVEAFPAVADAGLADIDTSLVVPRVAPLSEQASGHPCFEEGGRVPADEPGRTAAYQRILSSERDNGTAAETIIVYADEATAKAAMSICPDGGPALFGDAGDDARAGGSADTMYEGAVRSGTAVAYVRYFRQGTATEDEARAVFTAAAEALERVYG